MKKIILLLIGYLILISCSEKFTEGEETGVITDFKKTGLFWESWEGSLDTGYKSFKFSIDNDLDEKKISEIVKQIKRSYSEKTKITVVYHEVFGKNLFHNRGFTDCFVDSIVINKQSKLIENKTKK